ncbi:MAG: hypothetical protein F6J96_29005 [Symploca sp. SIO1C2]|nr:hypothetical protein [Symploca sp. SIO1C2]
MINCEGLAIFKKVSVEGETEVFFIVDCSQLEWESESQGERPMGMELAHSTTVELDDECNVTWELFEYPVGSGTPNHVQHELNGVVLLHDFEFSFDYSEDDIEEPFKD